MESGEKQRSRFSSLNAFLQKEAIARFSEAPEIKDGEISFNETDVLGEGTFGVVYKGKCRGCNVAIKIPKSGSASVEALSEKQLESFKASFFCAFCLFGSRVVFVQAEIEVMTKLYHPNIALFMGAFINPKAGQIKLVSELLTCDIEKILLDENIPLTLYERICFAEQAAEGMAWLHGAGVIHCDL